MLYRKITPGFVHQVFNDLGECLEQKFEPNDMDEVVYRLMINTDDDDGLQINVNDMPLGGKEYHPFNMDQPY